MYSDNGNTNVTSFLVLSTSYTCQADENTKMTDGMYSGYDAERRDVHSRSISTFLWKRSS